MAIRNLKHRKVRTAFLSAFLIVLTFSLLMSYMITDSMALCVNRTINRMGADIIVTSPDYANELSDSLFSGEICSFYIDRSALDSVAEIEEVDQMSPQLYIATLAAACCSVPIQIVAFEPETDFIVGPWLQELGISELKDGQVIIGNGLNAEGSIVFFEQELEIAGKLEKTGTTYDNCAYVNFETAKMLLETPKLKEVTGSIDPENTISTIMLKTKPGSDNASIARYINYHLEGNKLKAFTSQGMFDSITNSLGQLQAYSWMLIGLLFVMAFLALICIFNITTNERLREFGILMSIGVKKSQIVKMLLIEAAVIGLVASLIGIGLSGGTILLFSDVIQEKMNIPYIITDVWVLLKMALTCVGVGVLSSELSILYATVKTMNMEPFRLIQEENS